jgi:hypothetical protein
MRVNAINHAATALVIHRKWPDVPIVPVLISVQLVEILWVVFNLLGIERTTTNPQVLSMSDLHLAYMPYSHSIVATSVVAAVVWLVFAKGLNKPAWGVALAVGVGSHTVLDLLVHARDIALAPGIDSPKFGTGLYDHPMLALAVETAYGSWCWYYFKGSRALLSVILIFNAGTISFYSAAIPGPEQLMAGRPKLFAGFIGLHIAAGLAAIGYFARRSWRAGAGIGPSSN